MNEKISKAEDDWDSHWIRYAEANSENPSQQYKQKIIIDLIERKFDTQNNLNILDIGSGQGELLSKIGDACPTANLMGFELSRSGVEIAQRNVAKASFFEADMLSPPPSLKKFSSWAMIACCSEVLEHVDAPDLFLRNISNFIAQGGMLIITVPGGPMSKFDQFIGHRQHFSKASLKKLLLASGYQAPLVTQAGFPFHNLYRLLVILRGEKLKDDVASNNSGFSKYLAQWMMSWFRFLFKFNFTDSPFGWQLIGIAYKR